MIDREQEIAEVRAFVLTCEARGLELPDRLNRAQRVDPIIRATLDGDDKHLHGLKLIRHVQKQCGFGVLEAVALFIFVVGLVRLVLEYRRNKEATQ